MPIVANQAVPSMQQVPKIVYNPKTKELNISALGYQLRCPNGLKITWLPQANGGTLSQVRSIPGCLAEQPWELMERLATTLPPTCARRGFYQRSAVPSGECKIHVSNQRLRSVALCDVQMPTVEPATIAAQSSNSSTQTAIVATPIATMVDASPPFPTTVTFPDMPLQQVGVD